jgi:hypothetical protein
LLLWITWQYLVDERESRDRHSISLPRASEMSWPMTT